MKAIAFAASVISLILAAAHAAALLLAAATQRSQPHRARPKRRSP